MLQIKNFFPPHAIERGEGGLQLTPFVVPHLPKGMRKDYRRQERYNAP